MTLWLAAHASLALLAAHAPPPPEAAPAAPAARQSAGVELPSETFTDLDQLSFYVGMRSLDADFWAPLEDQLAFGLEYSTESAGSWLGWEAGGLYSTDEDEVGGVDVEGSSIEVYAGLHKTFLGDHVALRPYVGGGVSWISSDLRVSGSVSEDDGSLGLYAHGGLRAKLSDAFALGADLRVLTLTDIDIAGDSGDADYVQFAVTATFLL